MILKLLRGGRQAASQITVKQAERRMAEKYG